MASKSIESQLLQLVHEGSELSYRGLDPSTLESQTWTLKSVSVISSHYGKHSEELKSFRLSQTLNAKLNMVENLHSKEQSIAAASQSTIVATAVKHTANGRAAVHNDIRLEILLSIDHANLSAEEKTALLALFEDLDSELQKLKPNWQRTAKLLQRGLDYGMKIGTEFMLLANAYYRGARSH